MKKKGENSQIERWRDSRRQTERQRNVERQATDRQTDKIYALP